MENVTGVNKDNNYVNCTALPLKTGGITMKFEATKPVSAPHVKINVTDINEYRSKKDHSYHIAAQKWFKPGDEKFSFIKNPLNISNIVAGNYIVVHYDTLGQPNDLKAMPSEEFLDKFEAVSEEDAEKPHLRKRVTMRKDLMCPFCPAECR